MTEQLKKGLALSGGGFRATLYALGSLTRMNEEGLLTELDTITAVSGGAITAGFLMLKWKELKFVEINDKKNRFKATNFHEVIIEPLMRFCSQKVITPPLILFYTLNPFDRAVNAVCRKYEKKLFGNIKLNEIPDSAHCPEIVFYGTNMDTGASVRISKGMIYDYQIGSASEHDITLAQAVSISSGFPPFLSPICLDGSAWNWVDGIYQKKIPADIIEKLRMKLVLCDGGLYDNMGLEMLWKTGPDKEYKNVFVCDAGAPFARPWHSKWHFLNNWFGQSLRMNDIMIDQQRSLRKRTLTRNYIVKEYTGSYWSIENDLKDLPAELLSEQDKSNYVHLKNADTQLCSFGKEDNQRLVNLGFCHTDISLRLWFDKGMQPALTLPFPAK